MVDVLLVGGGFSHNEQKNLADMLVFYVKEVHVVEAKDECSCCSLDNFGNILILVYPKYC